MEPKSFPWIVLYRVLLSVALLLGSVFGTTALSARPSSGLVPLLESNSPSPFPDRYIVVLKESAVLAQAQDVRAQATARGAQIYHTYTAALNGFAATLPAQALSALRRHPSVKYIERDGLATIKEAAGVSITGTQQNAPWHLDRIDQRSLPLDKTYTYPTTADNAHVYVIGTGIRTTHSEFGGRASVAYDGVNDGRNGDDCNGHGTHLAGVAGGATYGAAKRVKLYAVRVLNCNGSGSWSTLIAGVDWMRQNARRPAVAVVALGGSPSQAVDDAVRNAVGAGITITVAAGGSNADACNYTPSRVREAIVVAASTETDARYSPSNYGACVDLFAPGANILSAWKDSDTATRTLGGSSTSAALVAGAAALYLAVNPNATPANVEQALITNATTGKISNPGNNTPNRLLYIGFIGGSPTPTPTATPAPTVVWPKLQELRPDQTAPGGQVRVIGSGGYLIYPDGRIDESYRTFQLFFDGQPNARIGCYVNRCEGDMPVPADATAGQHTVSVEGGSSLSLQVVGGTPTSTPTATPTVTPGTPTIPPPVFSDDFETNKGWMINSSGGDTATSGIWERGDPEATSYNGPKQLGTTTSGNNALVTGRLAGSSAGDHDIDGGVTSIRSPAIQWSGGPLNLQFRYYLAHAQNATSADYFRVKVIQGNTTTTVFEKLGSATDVDASWQAGAVYQPYFGTGTIYIVFEAADASGGSLVEAAVDDVVIYP